MKNFLLNCWDTLKRHELQRNDERCISVNATKVEKIMSMLYGQILSSTIMGNQPLRSEQDKVQRLSLMGVDLNAGRSGRSFRILKVKI